MYIKIKSLRVKASAIEAYYPSNEKGITILLDSGTELEIACSGKSEIDSIIGSIDNLIKYGN